MGTKIDVYYESHVNMKFNVDLLVNLLAKLSYASKFEMNVFCIP